MREILVWIEAHRRSLPLAAVDLTGGAPEMNPHFRHLVRELAAGELGPGGDEHRVERESVKLWHVAPQKLIGRRIRTGVHCFGCTAGAGSSCTGALGEARSGRHVEA